VAINRCVRARASVYVCIYSSGTLLFVHRSTLADAVTFVTRESALFGTPIHTHIVAESEM
jgi:hypothetical protein